MRHSAMLVFCVCGYTPLCAVFGYKTMSTFPVFPTGGRRWELEPHCGLWYLPLGSHPAAQPEGLRPLRSVGLVGLVGVCAFSKARSPLLFRCGPRRAAQALGTGFTAQTGGGALGGEAAQTQHRVRRAGVDHPRARLVSPHPRRDFQSPSVLGRNDGPSYRVAITRAPLRSRSAPKITRWLGENLPRCFRSCPSHGRSGKVPGGPGPEQVPTLRTPRRC